MKTTVKIEMLEHILDKIKDGVVTNENIEDVHFYCFNEDYYIIGYYEALEWLKKHDINTFDAIEKVKEYEMENFGEFTTEINSEKIVNMLAYIFGEEILYSLDFNTVEELKEAIEEML